MSSDPEGQVKVWADAVKLAKTPRITIRNDLDTNNPDATESEIAVSRRCCA